MASNSDRDGKEAPAGQGVDATSPAQSRTNAHEADGARPGGATGKTRRRGAAETDRHPEDMTGPAGKSAGKGNTSVEAKTAPPAKDAGAGAGPAVSAVAARPNAGVGRAGAAGAAPEPVRGGADDAAPQHGTDALSRAASTRASQIAPPEANSPGERSPEEGPSAVGGMPPARHAPTAARLAENIERIEALSHRLISALTSRPPANPGVEAPGPDLLVTAAGAWVKTMAEQPARMIEHQVNFWGETLKHYAKAQAALARGSLTAPEDDGPEDKRFRHPLWQSHPYFNFVKRQYQINAEAMRATARDLQLPDEIARRRVEWLTAQVIDMLAPTNFLATNPDALEKAVETEGESLVRGLENLVRDVEQNAGEMIVSLADRDAFSVGENIATTPGRVVHRTRLYELIQYAPQTDQVHAMPVVIFPPWINKFYILDLKPQNSLIRWIVEQGHTLFVVSWKNPDPSYADTGIEDYVAAYLEVMDEVLARTGQQRLNAVGYCIAGTTLALTLALMAQRGDERVNSATFFTTLTDFSDQGEFTTFLQDDFMSGIAQEIERHGILKAQLMSRTMSFLRANDLVWGPAIRSYMMGEAPPAFDLLFWNGDSTNLPGRMAMQYLHALCQQNQFAGDEGFELMGHRLKLSDITVPLTAIACESDHIAPWRDCWRGMHRVGSADKTFLLSQSGHVAGIVNPPGRNKYGHYAGGDIAKSAPEDWRAGAAFHEGSWWPRWEAWLTRNAGPMVDARIPDDGLEAAPGSYVHDRAR